MNKSRKEILVQCLMNQNALDADRDDAAMDLGEEFDDEFVLSTLIHVASNSNELDMILSSCGEAIGKIWVRKDFFDEKTYKKLQKFAQDGVYCIIESRRPIWLEKFNLNLPK